MTPSPAVEGAREVGGGELSAFVERNALVTEMRDVIEERHRGEPPHQSLGRISGALDKRGETSAVRVDQQATQIVQSDRESLHQFVSERTLGVLPEDARAFGAIQMRQTRRCQRSFGKEKIVERRSNREVTR